MLVLAREERGWTQAEAAPQLGIAQGTLSKLESGFGTITSELSARLSEVYGRPSEFFYYTGSIQAPTFVLYRKKTSVPPDVQKRFWARITLATIELKRLLTGAELTTEGLPYIDPDECKGGAAEVARRVRRMWKLPPGPIRNLMQVVENAGCIVVRLDFGTRKIDGCGGFVDGHPVIFVNEGMSAARQRLTIAHEVGHLIMHRFPSDEAEDQAFLFAGELLMPEADIKPMLLPLSMDKLARLKLYWLVSMQAVIMRAQSLGCIKPPTARYYWAKLNAGGFRETEPYDDQMKSEDPTLLSEFVATYAKELNYSDDDLAKLLLITAEELASKYRGFGNFLRVVK